MMSVLNSLNVSGKTEVSRTDKLDFKKPCWKEISPEGIDFVRCAFRNTHPPPSPQA